MQRLPWVVYLWPGLPQICRRGKWAGLATAFGAAIVLNAVLLSTVGWSELTNPAIRKLLWCAVGGFWAASAIGGYRQTEREGKSKRHDQAKETYPQALNLYLRGDYFQAECMLVEMLGRNERDLEARLTLATLYRRNRRYREALQQLDVLVRFDGAEKWTMEIERERMMIADGMKEMEEGRATEGIQPRVSRAA